jgi:hypothetical protein
MLRSSSHLYFFIIILIFNISTVYATTGTAILLTDEQISIPNDEIILNDTSTLILPDASFTAVNVTKFIGITNVTLTQQVQFVSNIPDNLITLQNTELTNIVVAIPDQTKISGPQTWDKTITPPKTVTTSGTVPSGFIPPTSAIQIGSPNTILVFDSPVIITLDGITGQMGYKLSGTNNWVLISSCLGPFTNPTAPPAPRECSINDGVNTKILTFHFTEFGLLEEETPPILETPFASTTSSGGPDRIGVGPHSGRGGSSMPAFVAETPEVRIFPTWFQQSLVSWWITDSITDEEFTNAVSYLLDKQIIDIDVPKKPSEQLLELAPSMKHLFGLWSNNQLPDSSITGIVHYYRSMGVW